jgi:hypothetical protein
MNWWTLITAGLALAACTLVNAAQPEGAAPPPIQVVLAQKNPNSPVGMYHNLQAACLTKEGLSDAEIEAKVKPLPKGVAERYLDGRDEYLFDGDKQAIFRIGQSMAIDLNDASCEPKLVRMYSAQVAVGCQLAASGEQVVPKVTQGGGLAPQPPESRAGGPDGNTFTCKRGATPGPSSVKTVGMPVLTVENLPCISWVDALLKVTGVAPRTNFAEGAGVDTCFWAKMPEYAHQKGRLVPVAIVDRHSADEVASRAAEGRERGTPQYMNMLPVEFQVGKPIPASRFTADAVRAFVSQSAILTVDVDHAEMK